ncbi:MAG: DUF992 domain-containing protein [Devosia sp.]
MNKLIAASLTALALTVGAAHAEGAIQVGRLSCDVEAGTGLIITSSKELTCDFIREGKKTEHYTGTIQKIGLDIGHTDSTTIEWLVFAASKDAVKSHALSGQYVGGSAEATLFVGLGGNFLVGGFDNSFALQPWSIQTQTGLNLSWTFTNLTLD